MNSRIVALGDIENESRRKGDRDALLRMATQIIESNNGRPYDNRVFTSIRRELESYQAESTQMESKHRQAYADMEARFGHGEVCKNTLRQELNRLKGLQEEEVRQEQVRRRLEEERQHHEQLVREQQERERQLRNELERQRVQREYEQREHQQRLRDAQQYSQPRYVYYDSRRRSHRSNECALL